MAHAPVLQQADQVIATSMKRLEQITDGRHRSVGALLGDLSISEEQASFELQETRLQTGLTELAVETAAELDKEGEEHRDAVREGDLFIAEHGLARRPPCGTLTSLGSGILIAVLIEEAGTAPMYAPVVGWPSALGIAALICLGVAVPAVLAGLGVVAAQHRLSRLYNLLGLGGIVLGVGLGLFALSCSALFRDVLAAHPALAANPSHAARAIWAAFAEAGLAPLVEPSNFGLTAIGAGAWGFTAWKTFRTFGYVGWREHGLKEQAAREAILDTSDEAQEDGKTAKAAEEKRIRLEVRQSRRAMRLLNRVGALDSAVHHAGVTGVAIGVKHRSAAHSEVTQAIRGLVPEQQLVLEAGPCPAGSVQLPDRISFQTDLAHALDRHGARVADEKRALKAMAEMHRAFVEGLRRATARALSGNRQGPSGGPGGPLLGASSGWRH